MLVLTRKLSEAIVLTFPDNTRVEVTVEQLKYDRVRIGIDAPRSVTISRKELLDGRSEAEQGKPA